MTIYLGTLAIGITANFINHNDEVEKNVEEISGIAYHFNPKFFDNLRDFKNIRLENIVYYKDETHYFVMTALKSSLLQRGVLQKVSLGFFPGNEYNFGQINYYLLLKLF